MKDKSIELKRLLHDLICEWCMGNDATIYEAIGVVDVVHSELVDKLKKIEP